MEISRAKTLTPWWTVLCHTLIAGSAIAAIVAMQKTQLQKPSLWVEHPQQAERQEALRLNLLSQMPSFGFDNMIANWTFLNFLQYYGDTPAREKTGFGLSPKYFDILTRRDPRFVDTYIFLSGTLSHQLGQPKLTLEYMQRGMNALSPEMNPKAFALWRMAALDQLLLLGDVPGTVRSLEMASKQAGATQEFKDLAPIFQASADFLRKNPDSRLVRLQSWSAVYQQAQAIADQKTQERARLEILALGGVEKVDEQGNTYFTLPAKP